MYRLYKETDAGVICNSLITHAIVVDIFTFFIILYKSGESNVSVRMSFSRHRIKSEQADSGVISRPHRK